jgi:hypothetical protein
MLSSAPPPPPPVLPSPSGKQRSHLLLVLDLCGVFILPVLSCMEHTFLLLCVLEFLFKNDSHFCCLVLNWSTSLYYLIIV